MSKERAVEDHKTRTPKPKESQAGDKKHGDGSGGDAAGLVHLQRQVGNQAVQRLITQRRGNEPATLDDSTAGRVEREKGKGERLPEDVQKEMSRALGEDFDDVRIHTSPEADELNRVVSAKAFTTGTDIFFRKGEYQPESSEGRELLAHELTHVVQQKHGQVKSGGNGTTVNAPNDEYEQQAERVSKDLAGSGGAELKREMHGGGSDSLQRAATQEEEEPLQTAVSQEEEEPLQTAATQEEEEPLQTAVSQEEEEPLQTVATQEEGEPLRTTAWQEKETPIRPRRDEDEEEQNFVLDGGGKVSGS